MHTEAETIQQLRAKLTFFGIHSTHQGKLTGLPQGKPFALQVIATRGRSVQQNVNQVIAEEIELLSELAEQQGNKVIVKEDTEATCYARASVLTIIMGNLLRNAINFTNNGTVTVHITTDRVTVSDTGIGMSLEDAENAFTAFYRGSAAASTAPGQGLGLALVRRLTQQLEWRVAIDSELNKGATFTVWMR